MDITAEGPNSVTEVMPTNNFDISGTMTIEETVRNISERAGYIRSTTTLLNGDATQIQRQAFGIQLETRTAQLVKQDPTILLDQLSDLGFAWRDIARMIGVSVPAQRRWRAGERPTGENRRAIARLLSFIQIIQEDHLVFEPASWMEVPIVSGVPITAINLYAAEHLELIFDLATEHMPPEVVLDIVEPNWREKYHSKWEVRIAEDGQPYIGSKQG